MMGKVREPLIYSHAGATAYCGMRFAKHGAANGYSIGKPRDKEDRPQSPVPPGLRENEAKRSFEVRPNRALALLSALVS